MALLSRAATDGVINGWKNAHKLDQTTRRSAHGGKNYGQVLSGGLKPSDQGADGPALPANPNIQAWIDVYQAPTGFGWVATFLAVEASVTYFRTLTCHEDGNLVETVWAPL